MRRTLRKNEDAFGRLLRDGIDGEPGIALLERDDGDVRPALPAAVFLAPPEEWPQVELEALERARGRVLDVGCGAGRHTLELQRRGLEVIAIDVSPGAVEVARRLGVSDVRLLPLAQVSPELGRFHTFLMLCGNLGLLGSQHEGRRTLRQLLALGSPDCRLVAESIDPHAGPRPLPEDYRAANARRGRLPGQVRLRMRYRETLTPWFDLLNVSPSELDTLVRGTGWTIAELLPGEPPSYVAILERASKADPNRKSSSETRGVSAL